MQGQQRVKLLFFKQNPRGLNPLKTVVFKDKINIITSYILSVIDLTGKSEPPLKVAREISRKLKIDPGIV